MPELNRESLNLALDRVDTALAEQDFAWASFLLQDLIDRLKSVAEKVRRWEQV